jgi:hypothetical protein
VEVRFIDGGNGGPGENHRGKDQSGSSSPYLFTKCLREMVKYWRKNAINIVLYLDDGFGMSEIPSCLTTRGHIL